MATVVKDFKIKSGLIVEGTTAKVNNFDILTKSTSDQNYIIDLIGGETLVKSVSNEFGVSVGGELSIDRAVVDAYYDAAGSASDAQDAAEAFATAADTTLYGTVTTDIATAKSEAGVIAQGYADDAESSAVATAAADATAKTEAAIIAADALAESSNETLYNVLTGDIADAKSSAISTAASDATTKANAAQAAAEGYADIAVANLVDGAPAVLDTLNELAAALQDNPDIITDLQDIASGKQDALTAGANIDITGATISVTGLDAADISDFDTAALTATAFAYDAAGSAQDAEDNAKTYADGLAVNYDAAGSAATAEQNAKDYADGVVGGLDTDDIEEGANNLYFTDARAKTSAAELLTGATLTNITITGTGSGLTITAESGVADSDTDDLDEGTENLYFTDTRAVDALQGTDSMFSTVDINEVALQVAATLSAPTAGVQTAYAWAHGDYRSAEFLVRVAYGTHTEISKVLLTLDTSDNIAITEYGIVGTNGSASTVSATISGTDVQLLVTTNNNSSTVAVVGTLLA